MANLSVIQPQDPETVGIMFSVTPRLVAANIAKK